MKLKVATGKFEVKTIVIKKRKAKKYRYSICKEVVGTIGERNRHMSEEHGLNEFKCGQCREKFET